MKIYQILITAILLSTLAYAAPTFTSTPASPQNLTEGNLFSFDVTATGEGTTTSYSVIFVDCTDCFTIHPTTGQIDYTPDASVRTFTAILIALDTTDFSTASTAVEFNINRIPQFTNLINQIASNNSAFLYDIDANDPDSLDTITFSSNNPGFPIDPSTGVISIPDPVTVNSLLGENLMDITVQDDADRDAFPIGSTTSPLTIVINDPAILDPIPPDEATEDVNYVLDVSTYASNVIGTLTYSDNASLFITDIFTIDPSTGVIDFTPTNNTVGNYTINISIEDTYGSMASREWLFNVTFVNDAPIFPAIVDQTGREGRLFSLDINATDEEGDEIFYFDDSTLFEINMTTGLINFTVTSSILGSYVINISVNDSGGALYSDTFNLDLIPNSPPIFPVNLTGTIFPFIDLYIDSSSPTTNFQNDEFLNVSGGSTIKRTFLKFNISDLNSSLTVINSESIALANLNLTLYNDASSLEISVHNISSEWDESINYNNQPAQDLESSSKTTLATKDSVDIFNLDSLVSIWYNGTGNRSLAVNLTDESQEDSVSYYSTDSSDKGKWPALSINYYLYIPDQAWEIGTALLDIIDLDDYFEDVEGDTLNYTHNGTFNIIVDIDENNEVSFTAVSGFAGEEYVKFWANDTIDETGSNVVKLTVEGESEFEPQVTTSPSTSSSTRTRTKTKTASIGIILDVQRGAVEKGQVLEVPITVKNTGEITLTNIDLSTVIDKLGIEAELSLYYLSTLVVGQEEPLSLFIDTENAQQTKYIISVDAKSKDVEESNVFVLDVITGAQEAVTQLEIAKRLFEDNPECLEFQEVVLRAEDQLRSNQIEQARSSIESAIEGCKSIIREEETPGLIERSFERILAVFMAVTVLTLLIIVIYLAYKKISYRFKEGKEE